MTKTGYTSTTKYLGGQGQTGKPTAKRDGSGRFLSRDKIAPRQPAPGGRYKVAPMPDGATAGEQAAGKRGPGQTKP